MIRKRHQGASSSNGSNKEAQSLPDRNRRSHWARNLGDSRPAGRQKREEEALVPRRQDRVLPGGCARASRARQTATRNWRNALHLLDLAMPLKDANGAVRGVLGAYLSFSWASKVKPVIQRADAEALVLARDGTVLLGPPELLGRSLTLPSLRRAQAEENGFGAEVWPDDIRYVAGFSQIGGLGDQPGLGWVVVRMKAEAPAFQWQTFIWSGGVGLVFTALGWFVAGRTTRRLQVVTQAAARVASGETLEDLPLLGREDELVSIAQHCANSQQARSATRRR